LLQEFPNPGRTGCPGPEILKGIAFHRVPLAQAEPWLDHITSCSPCYRDFSQFRETFRVRRTRVLIAVAASILVIASIAGWALFQTYRGTRTVQVAVLDLRNRSLPRSVQPAPAAPPLEIPRAASRLDIYLPIGSSSGPYEVRILSSSGATVLITGGVASLENHITELQVALRLSSLRSGSYVLQIRKSGLEWNSYPAVVR
jgi:hypothetical protein